MVGQMKKVLLTIAIFFLILVDLLFIYITVQDARGQEKSIDRYFWFQKYASEIGRDSDGKICVNQITDGEIVFRFSPETSPMDCVSVVKMLSEWRRSDERLDKIKWIYFAVDRSEGTKRTLLFRSGASQIGLAFYRSKEDSNALELYISPFLSEDFYKLSSYASINEKFVLFTEAYIALDDDAVFSKIIEWRCDDGLYTEEQLAGIEARGITVTVWDKEDVA